jgi:hypothetical protein
MEEVAKELGYSQGCFVARPYLGTWRVSIAMG